MFMESHKKTEAINTFADITVFVFSEYNSMILIHCFGDSYISVVEWWTHVLSVLKHIDTKTPASLWWNVGIARITFIRSLVFTLYTNTVVQCCRTQDFRSGSRYINWFLKKFYYIYRSTIYTYNRYNNNILNQSWYNLRLKHSLDFYRFRFRYILHTYISQFWLI